MNLFLAQTAWLVPLYPLLASLLSLLWSPGSSPAPAPAPAAT